MAPLADRVVAPHVGDITRSATAAGESALGNLIADAQRATMATQIGFMNPGGIRADLLCAAGSVCNATYGSLFTVQPFGNVLTKMELTGAQIRTRSSSSSSRCRRRPGACASCRCRACRTPGTTHV